MKIETIITDIEGTTTSLDFVKEVLFPYSMNALPNYLKENWESPVLRPIIEEIERIIGNTQLTLYGVNDVLSTWIKEDQKITPLKTLQGLIWEEGYRKGKLKGHLYKDAALGLQRWHNKGIKLYVYSSGSVHAQKLLFESSQFGDLTPLFSGYFDTSIGSKRDNTSYLNIINQIDSNACHVLFLSDIVAELEAAKAVGLQVIQVVRDADNSTPNLNGSFNTVNNFDEIDFFLGEHNDYVASL
jgi:enolase-phosphatase E1